MLDKNLTRESYWYANGNHSNGKRQKIRDLCDGHIINIILMIRDRQAFVQQNDDDPVIKVMMEEVQLRKLDKILKEGKYLPYRSERTGELIVDGSY